MSHRKCLSFNGLPDIKRAKAWPHFVSAGRPLHGETAFFLARRHANVRLDISGIPPKTLLRYVPRVSDLADKILWGTDWPSPGVVSPRKNVDDFLALGLGVEVEQKILWDNATGLFPERR